MKVIGYKTVNKVNNKFYFGVRTLRKNNDPYLGSGIRLKDAIKKYGKENFERIDLIEFKTFEEALEWERNTITKELVESKDCYNLKPGGAGGSTIWSKELKEKHKKLGSYKKSKETKKLQSKAALERFKNEDGTFKGKKHSEESKKKMSISRKGKTGTFKGKKHSEETKSKMRKPKSEETKRKIREALLKYHKNETK